MSDTWIAGAVGKNPGYLHRALHVPQGQKIPQGRIDKATHAESPHLAKAANLAKTLEHLHKKHGGSV